MMQGIVVAVVVQRSERVLLGRCWIALASMLANVLA